MQPRGFASLIVAIVLAFPAASAWSAPAPFEITAASITMPSRGNGSSLYTVTAIPLAGTLAVTCQYSGPATKANIPDCGYGPVELIPVTEGQTVTGTIYFYPFGVAVPAERRKSVAPGLGLASAGALILGLGLRRRSRRWLALLLLTAGSLAGMTAITACVGGSMGETSGPPPGTPGTYQYTVTAANESGGTAPLGQAVSTTISVTVP
jgi:hypothetical protein